jgi:hypothetical protein
MGVTNERVKVKGEDDEMMLEMTEDRESLHESCGILRLFIFFKN